MFYLIINQKKDIGISTFHYPVSIESCNYVWHNADLSTDENEHIIKNSDGVIVAFFPKSTTALFSDVKELDEKRISGHVTTFK